MPDPVKLQGVIAAAVTSIQQDFSPAYEEMPGLMDILARLHGFARWAVRPPLLLLKDELLDENLAGALSEVEGFTE